MKKLILQNIFDCFADWSKQFTIACDRGCALCCTQDVTMTAVEGELILDFIRSRSMQPWLEQILNGRLPDVHLSRTTNQYAQACLNGIEVEIGSGRFDAVCPFLHNDLCRIYPVRPFSCRCFASTQICRKGASASLPPEYLSAATAVSQIIEHLSQFDHWGNMLHVLYLQVCDASARVLEDGANLEAARSGCLRAQPLPGFLISEEETDHVFPLVESIFKTVIDHRTIEDILNGR
jgi:Fe-S-cluster containining protein